MLSYIKSRALVWLLDLMIIGFFWPEFILLVIFVEIFLWVFKVKFPDTLNAGLIKALGSAYVFAFWLIFYLLSLWWFPNPTSPILIVGYVLAVVSCWLLEYLNFLFKESKLNKVAAIFQSWLAGSIFLYFVFGLFVALMNDISGLFFALLSLPFVFLFYLFFHSAFKEVVKSVYEEREVGQNTTMIVTIVLFTITVVSLMLIAFFWW